MQIRAPELSGDTLQTAESKYDELLRTDKPD